MRETWKIWRGTAPKRRTVDGMIDISSKYPSLRSAAARAVIGMAPETVKRIRSGDLPKGDPRPVAKVTAVQAAKNTAAIIPYCHPIPVDHVGVEFVLADAHVEIEVTVKTVYKTGVEVEAMTAAAVAALTVYDMVKMVDAGVKIEGVELLWKKGGKSDRRESTKGLTAAVLVTSDRVSSGKKEDATGVAIKERLEAEGIEVVEYEVVPDDEETIAAHLTWFADERDVRLILTTGGTGFGPRDQTPEATSSVIEREAPGISEYIRSFGQDRTAYSMLSRGVAGLRKGTLIVNLPGSRGGVADSLDALFPGILHAFKMLRGVSHWDTDTEDGGA